MSTTKSSASSLIAIAFTLATAWTAACFDEEKELGGAACLTDADCWTTQACVQTPTQRELGIGGSCQASGSGCEVREQNGCACSTDPGETACNSSAKLRASNEDEREDCLCCDCSGVTGAVVSVDSNDACLCCAPNKGESPNIEVFVGVVDDECTYCANNCQTGDPDINCECPQDNDGTGG